MFAAVGFDKEGKTGEMATVSRLEARVVNEDDEK
jgi:hypothetical protein